MKNKVNRLFIKSTSNVFIQLFRHIFSGAIAFTLDFSLLYLLTEYAHLHYLLSTICGFLVGLITTYLLSIKWVFNQRRAKNKTIELLIFCFIGIIGLVFTYGFMWFFTSVLMLYYLVSKIITTIIVFGWNFIARKTILFTAKNQKPIA